MKNIILLLMLLLGLLGCAATPPLTHDQCNATQFPTAHEHELCIKGARDREQAEHEKADRRLVARDKLIKFLNDCNADDRFIVVEIRHGWSVLPNSRNKAKAISEYGYPYTHDNVHPKARSWDVQCWSRAAVRDFIRQL